MDRLEKLRAKQRAEMKAEYDAIACEIATYVIATDPKFGTTMDGQFQLDWPGKMLHLVGIKNTKENRRRIERQLLKRGFRTWGIHLVIPRIIYAPARAVPNAPVQADGALAPVAPGTQS